jgi:predicted ATPase/class 3 adenylate cyclase
MSILASKPQPRSHAATAAEDRPVRVDFRNRGADFAVLFLHGFLGRADTTWGDFPAFLIEHPELVAWDVFGVGYASSLRLDISGIWTGDASLETLGYYLRTTLAHRPFARYRTIAIVAHSMGGLVAQQALLDDEARERVSNLILFGTPSGGTRRATFARKLHAQARDMAEDSPFITNLRAAWAQIRRSGSRLKIRVIAAERDAFVPPQSSLGPFPEAMRFVVPGNHVSMVKPKDKDSLAVEIVLAALLSRDAVVAFDLSPVEPPTFLFADVEDGAARWERHPDEMSSASRTYERIVREAVTAQAGHVFKTVGEAMFAVFAQPQNAVAAAVDAQQTLTETNFTSVDGLHVRMALHTGSAEERHGDFLGGTVNRAARILSIAHGGQILTSGITAELARKRLRGEITLEDLGLHRLPDLTEPEAVYQCHAAGLPRDFPRLRSLNAKGNNLPQETTSFVGRTTELSEVRVLIKNHRLVTLVGAGGVGKSRLALHAAAELLDRFPDGIWLVELAAIGDLSLISKTMAAVLGLQDWARDSAREKVLSYLNTRALLLIVDNCEHLVGDIARIVAEIVQQCPHVHVVCTSRETLRVPGEHAYRMPSLPSIGAMANLLPEDAMTYGAVALFVDRATSADPHFSLTAKNVEMVAAICRRLDGIALAIELAAARVGTVPLPRLAEMLDKRLLSLAGGSRTALPRQQTMHSLIDWSYNLLSDRERRTFARLSVFAGGFSLDAAIAIACPDAADEFEGFDRISQLVDRSLVTVENRADDTRYRLLEPIREFAFEKLAEFGMRESTAREHANYFRQLIERADGTYWSSSSELVDPVVERDNLRAALQWTLERGNDVTAGAAIAAAMMRFGFFADDEGRRWADLARTHFEPGTDRSVEARLNLGLVQLERLSAAEMRTAAENAVRYYREDHHPQLLVEALFHASMTIALYFPSDCTIAEHLANEAVERARHLDAPRLVTLGLRAKAVTMDPDDLDGRLAVLTEALGLARANGDNPRLVTTFLMQLAEVQFTAQHYDDAVKLGKDAVELAAHSAYAQMIIFTKTNLAHYTILTREWDVARQEATEALMLAAETKDAYSVTLALNALAAVESGSGDVTRSARLFGFCDARFGSLHPPRQQGSCEAVVYRRVYQMLEHQLGAERLGETLGAGKTLSEGDAIALAQRS